MINSTADFESALDEVAGLLDKPFERETSERLAHLMRELQTYRPVMAAEPAPESPDAQRRRELQERVTAFQTRLRKEHHLMGDLGVTFGLFEDAETPDGVDPSDRPASPRSPGA